MNLSPTQIQILQADIESKTEFAALPKNTDGAVVIANYYNEFTTDVWVWRLSVSESEYITGTSSDGTTWSWTAYIARTQAERDAWARLFGTTGGSTFPALLTVRQAVAAIFSGSNNDAPAQRAHLLASSRRLARRWEALIKTGVGTPASPGTLNIEGELNYNDIQNVRVS